MRAPVAEVDIGGATYVVTKDDEAKTFEIEMPSAEAAVMAFRLSGSTLSLLHTRVPSAMRGRGVGEALARAVLDYARARGWTVKPYCPFVASFLARHPEYRTLVDPAFVPAGDA